jgi:ABC-2 type transport system permease protein
MTAQSIPSGAVAAPRPADRRLAGLGTLLRKDSTEWRRGKRAAVVFLLVSAIMVLTAANSWIVTQVAANLPPDANADLGEITLDPVQNLLAAVGTHLFVIAAILAVGSIVVAERQAGTLAWVASKPVARRSIWLSKWISSTAILAVSAVALPLAVTAGLVAVLYGAPDPVVVIGLGIGMAALVAFFTAVGVLAGTVLPSQVGVIAVGLGVLMVLPMVGAVLPPELAALLPTSILFWAAGVAAGMPAPVTTPIAFAITVAVIAAIGMRRIERIEL